VAAFIYRQPYISLETARFSSIIIQPVSVLDTYQSNMPRYDYIYPLVMTFLQSTPFIGV